MASTRTASLHRLWKYALPLLGWALIVWFCAATIHESLNRGLKHDDAVLAVVPKNFLNGEGWITSYDKPMLFNPDTSSGPTLLLPLTVGLAWVGPQIWLPSLTAALLNLGLLALVGWRLYRLSPAGPYLLFVLLLITGLYRHPDFTSFTGYYMSALLVILAALSLAETSWPIRARFGLAGLLAGAAFYVKVLTLPGMAALLLSTLCLDRIRAAKWRHLGASITWWAGGLLLVCLPWETYKLTQLQQLPEAVQALRAEYGRQFFLYHGSGLGQWLGVPDQWQYLLRNHQRNFNMLTKHTHEFGLDIRLLLLLFLLSNAALIRHWYRNTPLPFNRLLLTLAAVSWVYFAWFLSIAMAYSPSHLFFGMISGYITIAGTLLAVCPTVARPAALMALAVAAMAMQPDGFNDFYRFNNDDSREVTATQTMVEDLRSQDWPWPLAGCGYAGVSRRLEFLLPGSGHFRDCFNLIEEHLIFDETDYLSRYPRVARAVHEGRWLSGRDHYYHHGFTAGFEGRFHWGEPVQFHWVLDRDSFLAGLTNPAIHRIGKLCRPHVRHIVQVGDIPHYAVLDCPWNALQALDRNALMKEILQARRWYRTRYRPWPSE